MEKKMKFDTCGNLNKIDLIYFVEQYVRHDEGEIFRAPICCTRSENLETVHSINARYLYFP